VKYILRDNPFAFLEDDELGKEREKQPFEEDEEPPWKSKEDTENIYDEEQREKMLGEDEIT